MQRETNTYHIQHISVRAVFYPNTNSDHELDHDAVAVERLLKEKTRYF
jgi:hypothetical protein